MGYPDPEFGKIFSDPLFSDPGVKKLKKTDPVSRFDAKVWAGALKTWSFGAVECSIAQLVARWPAVRQAPVKIPARHHWEVFPAERKQ